MGAFRENKPVHSFILLVNVAIILLSYYFAFHVRFLIGDIPLRNMSAYINLLPYIAVFSLFVLLVYELYAVPRSVTWQVVSSVIVAVTIIAGLTGLASFAFRQEAFPRSTILIGSVIAVATLLLWLSLCTVIFQQKKRRILIIGTEEEIAHVTDKVKQHYPPGTHFKVMMASSDIDKMIHGIHTVDVLFICNSVEEDVRQRLLHECMHSDVQVFLVPKTYELMLTKAEATAFDDLLVLSVNNWKLRPEQQLLKRLGDIVFSLVFIIITLPLMVLVAIVLKVTEPHAPVFYTQRRVTMNDREFNIYKFRTMIPNAEAKTGPTLATEDDDRITKVGRFLRATRIDELPQLFNVLRGEMSVVGPRPERPHFTKIYKKQFGTYRYRSAVKAGLTGLAQVEGKYETSVEDKLRYDLYYIRNYSILLDIVIMLKTIGVLLDKQKSSGISLRKVSMKRQNKYGG